jgi:hypothetical protein
MDYANVASDLIHYIVSEARADELTPFERLYVAEHSKLVSLGGRHADLYIKCGCLEEALRYDNVHRHPRRLGDIHWSLGDYESARANYSVPPSRNRDCSRFSVDWDRLIKLAFFRSDWRNFMDVIP